MFNDLQHGYSLGSNNPECGFGFPLDVMGVFVSVFRYRHISTDLFQQNVYTKLTSNSVGSFARYSRRGMRNSTKEVILDLSQMIAKVNALYEGTQTDRGHKKRVGHRRCGRRIL